MNEKTATIMVWMRIPDGQDADDVEEYVNEAVRSHCKTLSPGAETPDQGPDYFYHADQNIIKIAKVNEPSAMLKITKLRAWAEELRQMAKQSDVKAREIERTMERLLMIETSQKSA